MNQPIKPKLKPQTPQPTPEKPAQVMKPIVELAASEFESGETGDFDHLASLDGLGLLTEIAKIGGQVFTQRNNAAQVSPSHPADPRKRTDPRKRDLPR